jgi:hypothetical protein
VSVISAKGSHGGSHAGLYARRVVGRCAMASPSRDRQAHEVNERHHAPGRTSLIFELSTSRRNVQTGRKS